MHLYIFLAAVLLIAFACFNAAGASETYPADGKQIELRDNGARIERYAIASAKMKRDIKIAVVLPPNYDDDKDRRFPIVYCLHGMDAPYDTFANMTKLSNELTDKPMIFACFDADKASWYIDSTEKPDSQFETFFFDEYIPYIDNHYRTNGKRGVIGFSMGGFGAMYYSLRKPELFKGCCTLSGGLHAFAKADERMDGMLEPYIGNRKSHPRRYEAIDVLELLKSNVASKKTLPQMSIRCGTEDFLLQHNRDFVQLLIDTNAKITEQNKTSGDKAAACQTINFHYTEQPGAHNWAYWHAQAPDFVDFFWRVLSR